MFEIDEKDSRVQVKMLSSKITRNFQVKYVEKLSRLLLKKKIIIISIDLKIKEKKYIIILFF